MCALFIMIIPHPSFRLNEHKSFYSPRTPLTVTWFLSKEEIRSSFKNGSAEQSYIDLDYSVFLIFCQSAAWHSLFFVRLRPNWNMAGNPFPSSLKSTCCCSHRPYHDWCASPFGNRSFVNYNVDFTNANYGAPCRLKIGKKTAYACGLCSAHATQKSPITYIFVALVGANKLQ